MVLEHARFYLKRDRHGRNGGVFCGGCGEWRSARRRGAWRMGKACRAERRQELPGWQSVRSGLRENEAVPSEWSPEPTYSEFPLNPILETERNSKLVGMARNPKAANGARILALAISLEEEDGRVYADFADELRDDVSGDGGTVR